MSNDRLAVFFHEDVLATRPPDGVFERAPSPLLEHQTPTAECPERIANIKSVLERAPSAERFQWHEGRHATDEEVLSFHTQPYLDQLRAWDREGHWATSTTYLPASGLKSVLAGAGTTMEALSEISSGRAKKAYALIRPPCHHAAPDVADGYCFVNAVGMAANVALRAGCEKVAVLDWDVHHGNGTQEGFYRSNQVLYISAHMNHGAWGAEHPQTGEVDEVGSGAGKGFNLNLPLPYGSGDLVYEELTRTVIVPALRNFGPDLIIVSNGQDANQFDPNGRQLLTMSGFHDMAQQIGSAADELCDGKLLIVQEGGYNVAYVGFCAYGTALGFLGAELDVDDPLAFYPEDHQHAKRTVQELVDRHPLLDANRTWNS